MPATEIVAETQHSIAGNFGPDADMHRSFLDQFIHELFLQFLGTAHVDADHRKAALGEGDCRRLSRLARRALIFAEEGRAHLVQRRHGDGDYSYLAIKARTPARRMC